MLGKGRKERSTPLKAETAQALSDWLHERQGAPADPVFPGRRGQSLSHDAISKLLAKHTTCAASHCPSLAAKRVTPHVLRHTNAMLLQTRRVDIYQHADNKLKEEAIDSTAPIGTPPGRYRPADTLLAFLESLTVMPTNPNPQPLIKQRRRPA